MKCRAVVAHVIWVEAVRCSSVRRLKRHVAQRERTEQVGGRRKIHQSVDRKIESVTEDKTYGSPTVSKRKGKGASEGLEADIRQTSSDAHFLALPLRYRTHPELKRISTGHLVSQRGIRGPTRVHER
jgi:hypothetical protein